MRGKFVSVLRPAAVGLLVALGAFAQPHTQFEHERDIAAQLGRVVPRWGGSELVGVDAFSSRTPLLYAVDREGRREEIWIDLPGAGTVLTHDAIGGADGAVAAVGYAQNPDPLVGHFLMWISPDRKRRTVIRLDPYGADRVALAGDGTIWVVGGLRDAPRWALDKQNVIRRYDASGKQLGSFPVHARSREDISPDAAAMSYFVASKDRVGWFTNGSEYIEFSLDGKEVGRFDGPPYVDRKQISGVGLDAEDRLFVGRKGDKTFNFEILELNRSNRTWSKAAIVGPDAPRSARILGFDGTALVTMEQAGIRRYARTRGEAAAQ
jgi:hypothetical protein